MYRSVSHTEGGVASMPVRHIKVGVTAKTLHRLILIPVKVQSYHFSIHYS